MANNRAGQVLSPEEVAEYREYNRLSISLPDKFDGVVMDNTMPTGAIYRYPTADETKANEDAAKAAAESAKQAEALTAKVRAEAAKRDAEPLPKPAAGS